MRLVGTYRSFVDWVLLDTPRHNRNKKHVFYQATNAGRITSILYTPDSIEWIFPANEHVTIEMIKDHVGGSIKINDWTIN